MLVRGTEMDFNDEMLSVSVVVQSFSPVPGIIFFILDGQFACGIYTVVTPPIVSEPDSQTDTYSIWFQMDQMSVLRSPLSWMHCNLGYDRISKSR